MHRGKAMQNAVPNGEGGMLAVLGIEIDKINSILNENIKNFNCYIANDNSNGQVVMSGKINDLDSLSTELKKKNIKFVKLPVSAPFHCPLMKMQQLKWLNELITQIKFIKLELNLGSLKNNGMFICGMILLLQTLSCIFILIIYSILV